MCGEKTGTRVAPRDRGRDKWKRTRDNLQLNSN